MTFWYYQKRKVVVYVTIIHLATIIFHPQTKSPPEVEVSKSELSGLLVKHSLSAFLSPLLKEIISYHACSLNTDMKLEHLLIHLIFFPFWEA